MLASENSNHEQFWKELYPVLYPAVLDQWAVRDTQHLLSFLKLSPGKSIDFGCGSGRHVRALAAAGFESVGIDISPFMLAKARSSLVDSGLRAQLIEGAFEELTVSDEFDLALSCHGSYGQYVGERSNEELMSIAYKALRPGGYFVLEACPVEILSRRWPQYAYVQKADRIKSFYELELVSQKNLVQQTWTAVIDGQVKIFSFSHTPHSAEDLQTRAEGAGFKSILLCGDFDGRRYGALSDKLILIARKPND